MKFFIYKKFIIYSSGIDEEVTELTKLLDDLLEWSLGITERKEKEKDELKQSKLAETEKGKRVREAAVQGLSRFMFYNTCYLVNEYCYLYLVICLFSHTYYVQQFCRYGCR